MLAVVWSTEEPWGTPFGEVAAIAFGDYGWLLLLAMLEAVRQLHYLAQERSCSSSC